MVDKNDMDDNSWVPASEICGNDVGGAQPMGKMAQRYEDFSVLDMADSVDSDNNFT